MERHRTRDPLQPDLLSSGGEPASVLSASAAGASTRSLAGSHSRQKLRVKRKPREGPKAAASREPGRSRSSGRPQQRMREIRTKETGDYAIWYRVRRRLVECVGLLIDMDKMTFWEAIPDDELDTVVDELGELQRWTEAVLEGIGQRYSDDRLRAKIAALRETSGRTPAEIETASRLAGKLEAKL